MIIWTKLKPLYIHLVNVRSLYTYYSCMYTRSISTVKSTSCVHGYWFEIRSCCNCCLSASSTQLSLYSKFPTHKIFPYILFAEPEQVGILCTCSFLRSCVQSAYVAYHKAVVSILLTEPDPCGNVPCSATGIPSIVQMLPVHAGKDVYSKFGGG